MNFGRYQKFTWMRFYLRLPSIIFYLQNQIDKKFIIRRNFGELSKINP